MVPVLRDWEVLQPVALAPKPPAVFLRDYCISSLVLAAQFRFKPVVGRAYYLYARAQDWNLSLIAPDEWGERRPGECLGACRLRPDMTWEIDTAESCGENAAALARAGSFVQAFVETLSAQEGIAANLPFYASGLPYYQRLLATALSVSLQRTMPHDSAEVHALLADPREWLLPAGDS